MSEPIDITEARQSFGLSAPLLIPDSMDAEARMERLEWIYCLAFVAAGIAGRKARETH